MVKFSAIKSVWLLSIRLNIWAKPLPSAESMDTAADIKFNAYETVKLKKINIPALFNIILIIADSLSLVTGNGHNAMAIGSIMTANPNLKAMSAT